MQHVNKFFLTKKNYQIRNNFKKVMPEHVLKECVISTSIVWIFWKYVKKFQTHVENKLSFNL